MLVRDNMSKNLDVLERLMSASMLRQKVMANNIANFDTPNFKRSQVSFETFFQKSLNNPITEIKTQVPQLNNDTRYLIPLRKSWNYTDVKPKIQVDYLTQSDNNGNNVDMEEEMGIARQELLRFRLMKTAVMYNFNQIKEVIK